MNYNYDPLEDTTYDDLSEDPYSHSPLGEEFEEDFPSKPRRSAIGARCVDDEMTDGPVDENSKEGEDESFLSPSGEACFWGQPGEISTVVRDEPPAVLEPPPLLRIASMPETTANPVASPSRSRVAYHPYRSQTSSALSDTTDSTSISGSSRRESTDDPEMRAAPRGIPRSQTSHSRATSIAIIEDMRTGTPLYDMSPTQVREEQRRQLRARYTCSERWLQVVERCLPYELPSPEDCSEHAPEEMKALIHVPNRARARGNAIFSHFFRSVKVFDEGEEKSKYICAIMTDDSCKTKLSGGAGMIGRESHMNSTHKEVYEAFRLFQGLQNCLERLPVDLHASKEQQEYQAPSTPKRTPRKSKFLSALPGIPIPTLEDKATVEACWLNLLSEGAVNYSLFDNPNFRKIKAVSMRGFDVHASYTMKKKVANTTRDKYLHLRGLFARDMDRCAITFDGWTSADQRKYLGITMHYITPSLQTATILLDMVLIEGERQTGEFLLIKLKEVLAAWGLEGKVIAATTDQGSNMKKCLSLYQETSNVAWIACAAHKMQLCISKAWEASATVAALISKCSEVSVFFRTHPNAMSILAEEQRVLFGKSYKLLAMNHTRWNSKYVMIARVVKVSPAFEKAYRRMLAAHNDQRANALSLKKLIPSEEEVAILNELIRLLQGAANFTHWVGQLENPTISQVYPRIEGILPAIDTFLTDGPREMHQQLEKELRQAWSYETIPDSMLVAMFLTPAYGKLDMWNTPLPADARLPPGFEVTDMVFRMLNGRSDPSTYLCKVKYLVVAEIIRLQEEDAQRSAQDRQDSQVSTPSRQKRFHSGPIQTLVRRRMNAAMIVQDYCEQIATEENDFSEFADLPLDYWNERQEDLEAAYLIRVARAYLGIPATSSESERSFSRAGRILATNRCRMLHTTFRNLMRSHSFNKFFCRFPHYLNPGYLYWH